MKAFSRLAVALFASFIIALSGVCIVISPGYDQPALQIQTSQAQAASNYTAHKWSFSKYPLYYKVRGKAIVNTSVKKGQIKTSKLDSLGRTRAVTAKVTYSMVKKSAGLREDFDSTCDSISGWGNQKKVKIYLSNGKVYNGYAWNRSHLLADSLGGHATRKNLITGTRTQNVGNNNSANPGGMAYTEALARNYLYKHHNGWVYYKATPVYKGKELIPRSVYVDIKSDDGSINMHVEVFNAMNGYNIDYKTGKISKGVAVVTTKATSKSSSSSSASSTSSSKSSSASSRVYITATGKKYHNLGCRYLRSSCIATTLSAAKAAGLSPCSVCF